MRQKPRTYYQQIAAAVVYETKLNAKLTDTYRKYSKVHFTFTHNVSKKKWTTTLSKLENYGHNKFKKESTVLYKRKTQKQVIKDFNIKHSNFYTYKFTTYINKQTKIIITCPIHGNFKQQPSEHLRGRGCPTCGNTKKSTGGWGYTNWENQGGTSKKFESYKVYIIRCYNEQESFIKIGKTFYTIEERFNNKTRMPYNYEILKVIEGEARMVSELEVTLHRLNKEFKYTTLKDFRGENECFSKIKEETFDY